MENVDDVLAISHPRFHDFSGSDAESGTHASRHAAYDLAGRRIAESAVVTVPSVLPKGVYIVGHRKVVLP